ncbi:MAG: hypothetical protein JJU29_23685 [Verrucomicrobia bacterium]|nr:hypothetical protein [Verrucomicrobiota bacterium]MCH8510115.1 hypothetical protein [Kiritimatiellia bacterium]
MQARILIPWKDCAYDGQSRVTEYLRERGFVKTNEDNDQEIFQRGNLLGNLTSFDMRKIKTCVRLYRKGDFLVVKYIISAFGQFFSEDDVAFFDLECKEIEAVALGTERVPPEIWEDYEEFVKNGWIKFLKGLTIPMLLLAFVAGGRAILSGSFENEKIPQPSGDSSYVASDSPAVYLIPFEGFPEMMAQELASWLSRDLGVFVKAMPAAAMDFAHFNAIRNQYVVESFYEGMWEISSRLPERTERTAIIFLTDQDLYVESANFRFVLSSHWGERLSIVGTGRYGRANEAAHDHSQRFQIRTLKLLKRTIGLQYFGYERASDPESLMYSPVSEISDLDRMDLSKW